MTLLAQGTQKIWTRKAHKARKKVGHARHVTQKNWVRKARKKIGHVRHAKKLGT